MLTKLFGFQGSHYMQWQSQEEGREINKTNKSHKLSTFDEKHSVDPRSSVDPMQDKHKENHIEKHHRQTAKNSKTNSKT